MIQSQRQHPSPGTLSASETFEQMVHEHWRAVHRLLRSLTRNWHATEDLTQETFLRALRRLDSFQPGTSVRNWLLRIASNAYLDEHRKGRRWEHLPLANEPVGRDACPGQLVDTAEQAALVEAALDELTPLTRMVFHLRVHEDLSFREIAELAETSEQSARWHMHQARTRVLARLERST